MAALHSAPDPLHQRFSEEFARIPDYEQAMILAAVERIASLVQPAGSPPGEEQAHVLEVSDVLDPDPKTPA